MRDHKGFMLGAVSIIAVFIFMFAAGASFAGDGNEITLFYTGETHAMLYPCSCPVETDGGVARRAALLKELRKNDPNSLLLDSGGFFAGGLMDEYTQSVELDTERTKLNLRAMSLMKYDAAAVGDEEFNFGRKFLEAAVKDAGFPMLAANIDMPGVLPFIVKKLPAGKVGIIGLTPASTGPKSGGLKVGDAVKSVSNALAEVTARGAEIIVLLSHMGESEDLELLKAVEGIDVVITGNGGSHSEPAAKNGRTVILRPSWQGRRLGKAVLILENRRMADYRVEAIRLSDKISDDRDIISFLPECFADGNCKKGSLKGKCSNPGERNAKCDFPKEVKTSLSVVVPRNCPLCRVDVQVDFMKKQFPGLDVSFEYYPGEKAEKLISAVGMKTLPAFVFGKELEKASNFPDIKDKVDFAGGYYYLKPQYGGAAYFLGRESVPGRVDAFLSLQDPYITVLLDRLEEFEPEIHFVAGRTESGSVNQAEIEEILRSVCVKKYYPSVFWSYIDCRVRKISSSWWDDCLPDLDPRVIKACAQGAEGLNLLNENSALSEELGISSAPTYVVGNQHVFASKQPPEKEEFRRIFTGKNINKK